MIFDVLLRAKKVVNFFHGTSAINSFVCLHCFPLLGVQFQSTLIFHPTSRWGVTKLSLTYGAFMLKIKLSVSASFWPYDIGNYDCSVCD